MVHARMMGSASSKHMVQGILLAHNMVRSKYGILWSTSLAFFTFDRLHLNKDPLSGFHFPPAGANSVVLHIDHIRTLIPPGIPLHGLADAGMFPDAKNMDGVQHFRGCSQRVFNMQQARGKD